MYPALNPEVKCLFRWYTDENRIARNSITCREGTEPAECKEYALWSPNNALLPFQLWVPSGENAIESWKVYDLEGNQVADLEDDLALINVRFFVGRDYLTYYGDALSSVLAPGFYESRLVVSGTTYYSETFQTFCGTFGGDNILPNGDFENGTQGFAVDPDWDGVALARFNTLPIDFPDDPEVGDVVISREDNMLYTWDGADWIGTTPAEGDAYVVGLDLDTLEWWRFVGGEWDPGDDFVVFSGEDGACWTGLGDVPLTYTPGLAVPTVVQLSMMVQQEGGVIGSLTIAVDGVDVAVLSNANVGQVVTASVTLGPGSVITLTPSSGFIGCLLFLQGYTFSADPDCFHTLKWSNCGAVGTQYYDDGFQNIMYIPQANIIHIPSPDLSIDDEEDRDGSQQETFKRKEVNYSLSLDRIPWYQLDALTEIPLHSDVLLHAAEHDGEDELMRVTVDYEWPTNEYCLAGCTLTFQVDEATVASSCCVTFDPPCLFPCIGAVGFSDAEEPVLGEIYLIVDKPTYATYEGFDNGPVDANGFGPQTACESRMAVIPSTVDPGADVYWIFTGTEWELLAEVTSMLNVAEGSYVVTGNIQGGYSGQLQYSTNEGSTWTDIDVPHTANEWLEGVEVELPDPSVLLRFVVLGPDDCQVGFSPKYPCLLENIVDQDFSSLAGWFFNTSLFSSVVDEAALSGLPDPEEGDMALTQDTGTFFQYTSGNWVEMDPEDWPITAGPDGICSNGPIGSAIEFSGFLSETSVLGQTYQVTFVITGTGGDGEVYITSTFPSCGFERSGTFSCLQTVSLPSGQFNIRLEQGFDGCIEIVTIRQVCDQGA